MAELTKFSLHIVYVYLKENTIDDIACCVVRLMTNLYKIDVVIDHANKHMGFLPIMHNIVKKYFDDDNTNYINMRQPFAAVISQVSNELVDNKLLLTISVDYNKSASYYFNNINNCMIQTIIEGTQLSCNAMDKNIIVTVQYTLI